MRPRLRFLGAAALLVAFAPPGFSDSPSGCADHDAERSITACTFIIDGKVGSARDIAIALCNRGNAYASQGHYDRAIEDYTGAIALHPRSPGAYNNRANALSALARYAEAIADYTEAIRLDPGHVGAHYNRGVSLAKTGQLDHAIVDLTEVIRLKPDHAAGYFTRGMLHLRNGDREQAVVDLRKTLAIDASHQGARDALRTLAIPFD
jgi:tetratricopeptide (TPR) repeat protein